MSAQLRMSFDAPKPAGTLTGFHVRGGVPLGEALAGVARAAGQDARVLALFEAHPGQRFTPSQVHALLCWTDGKATVAPLLLTSCRRALTNLTARGLLVHYPNDRRKGPAGATEGTWGLARG